MKKLLMVLGCVAALVATVALALPTVAHKAGLHPDYNGPTYKLPGKRALVIATNHSVLTAPGETEGDATGVFMSELTHPYYTLLDGGMSVDVASVKGGQIAIDPMSFNRITKTGHEDRYEQDPVLQAKVENSIAIADLDFTDYDIIFLAGGWGAAYDLGQSELLGQKISQAYYAADEPFIGGVCHGVLGLIQARDRDGNLLIAGRTMTGVTDKQVKELGIDITPLHPETELRKAGAKFEAATAFRDMLATYVAVDQERRFVTGQNQNSGLEAAHVAMGIFAERR